MKFIEILVFTGHLRLSHKWNRTRDTKSKQNLQHSRDTWTVTMAEMVAHGKEAS